jgi:cytochrome c553
MKKVLLIALALTASAATVYVHADAASDAGKNKAATCGACHGMDGNSTNPQFPKLAGQNASYIEAQLADFKSGKRQNAIMAGQAAGLSAQDMQALAAYFSSQTVTVGQAVAGQVKQGEQLYRNGNAGADVPACLACHGPDGAGNLLMKVPALAGQHSQYVVEQLQNYANGSRSTDPNKMMETIASRLTPAEVQAVASYIEGLHHAEP